ncbi:MAG: hypothetical protein K5798_02395 [Nitrosopumilus sp.]|uniref:DUF6659 family protein n=1 Tax=Nitrosopumilus sp. TaxID=2024843 RepID=UPI00242D8536|nr:DUF6659 family protein [Nitrosopumilus sp.]MCV0366099.1 hypothetical protein [Nitrosopumilus sp.]
MSVITSKKIENFDDICKKILQNNDIRYVCILNKMANLILEKKQNRVKFLLPDKKSRDLYLKLKLESSLIKDFDDELGQVEFIVTYRKKIQMISIPIYGKLVMVSAKKNANSRLIANTVLNLFRKIIN